MICKEYHKSDQSMSGKIVSSLDASCLFNCYLDCFFKVLLPFRDYFSSNWTDQSIGGAKTGELEKKHLAHPEPDLGLSQVPLEGLEPTPFTVVTGEIIKWLNAVMKYQRS